MPKISVLSSAPQRRREIERALEGVGEISGILGEADVIVLAGSPDFDCLQHVIETYPRARVVLFTPECDGMMAREWAYQHRNGRPIIYNVVDYGEGALRREVELLLSEKQATPA